MKKMMKVSGGLMAAVMVFAFAGQARAYCVHNETDRQMTASQVLNCGPSTWQCFKQDIDAGQQKCCNWSTSDCNESGGQTDPVGFDVYYKPHWYSSSVGLCHNYQIPANGDLYIKGSNGNYSCSQ